jgi:hypothetical protein
VVELPATVRVGLEEAQRGETIALTEAELDRWAETGEFPGASTRGAPPSQASRERAPAGLRLRSALPLNVSETAIFRLGCRFMKDQHRARPWRSSRAPVSLALPAVAWPVFLGLLSCVPTTNRATVSGGRIFQQIECGATTPGKCTTRAREVCAEYTVIEPLHPVSPDNSSGLTMRVECGPATAAVDAGAE